MEGLFGGIFRRDSRAGTTNLRGRQEMSGIHEEVFLESTAKRRVEGLLGGKFRRDDRPRTTKPRVREEMSGIGTC